MIAPTLPGIALCFLVGATIAVAQAPSSPPSPVIARASSSGAPPVRLRNIWQQQGDDHYFNNTGAASGSIGDINNDGLGDFVVSRGDTLDFFLGASPAPSNVPFQQKSAYEAGFGSTTPLAVGDFWGTRRQALCFRRYHPGEGDDIVIYRTESGRLPDTAALLLSTRSAPDVSERYTQMSAADLDRDGFD